MKTPCNAQAGSIWQRLGPGPANDVAIPAFLDPLAVAAHHWPAESIKPDATAIHVELHLTAYHPAGNTTALSSPEHFLVSRRCRRGWALQTVSDDPRSQLIRTLR